MTHFVGLRAEQEQIEGYGGDHVDEKPSLQIVDRYLARMNDQLQKNMNTSKNLK